MPRPHPPRLFRHAAVAAALIALLTMGGVADAATTITAAGDIACPRHPCRSNRDTARLVRSLDPTAALTLGDNQYEHGALRAFRRSYERTWGTFRSITNPVPGNHDYETRRAAGYFRYFGSRAHRRSGGHYSYNLGDWHLIALNSERNSAAQTRWLRRGLRRDHHVCELAYWHEPRWSSGLMHGGTTAVAGWWRVLFRAGVDVVLNGHEHNYERFARLSPGRNTTPRGIRELVVGTGGMGLYPLGRPVRGSQVRLVKYGVLQMTLDPASYSWRFVKTGGAIGDSGTTTCHT